MAVTRDQVIIELIAQTKAAITGIKSLGASILTVVAAAKSFEAVARQAFESTRLAAAFNQQIDAFRNLTRAAGTSADEFLQTMTRMAGGTITQVQLMRSVTTANLLGVGFEEMPKLMEISRASALATGKDMGFLFESITTGIGRSSPLILDNLGLMIRLEDIYADYAQQLGVAVSELIDVEKKQGLVNEVMKQGEGIIADVGLELDKLTDLQRIDALKTAFQELSTEIGQGLLPKLAEGAGLLFQIVSQTTANLATLRQNASDLAMVQAIVNGTLTATRDISALNRLLVENSLAQGEQQVEMLIAIRTRQALEKQGLERDNTRIQILLTTEDLTGQTLANLMAQEKAIRDVLTASEKVAAADAAAVVAAAAAAEAAARAAAAAAAAGNEIGAPLDVGVLAGSVEEIVGLVENMRIIAGAGGADLGLGGLLNFEDVPQMVDDLTDLQKAMEGIAESVADALSQGFLDTFQALGDAIATGADDLEAMANAWKRTIAAMMATVAQQMLVAGLNAIATAKDPAQFWIGVALVVGSGLVALVTGLAGGGGTTRSATSTTGRTGSASSAGGGALGAPQQPAGTIVVQNIQGNVWTERQLIAAAQRAR